MTQGNREKSNGGNVVPFPQNSPKSEGGFDGIDNDRALVEDATRIADDAITLVVECYGVYSEEEAIAQAQLILSEAWNILEKRLKGRA